MDRHKINVSTQTLHLLSDRGVWWGKEQTLFISDVHLQGTAGVNSGKHINITPESDVLRFKELMSEYCPKELVVLGDLFERFTKKDVEHVDHIFRQFESQVTLLLGNHDHLKKEMYHFLGIKLISTGKYYGPFYAVHDYSSAHHRKAYVMSGHVHPGATLSNSIKLPAFVVGKHRLILPAFGSLAGTGTVPFMQDDRLFVISKRKLVEKELIHSFTKT